jgi:hypothetical protein
MSFDSLARISLGYLWPVTWNQQASLAGQRSKVSGAANFQSLHHFKLREEEKAKNG